MDAHSRLRGRGFTVLVGRGAQIQSIL